MAKLILYFWKTEKQPYMLFYKQYQAEISSEIIIISSIKKNQKEVNILNEIHTLLMKSSV